MLEITTFLFHALTSVAIICLMVFTVCLAYKGIKYLIMKV